MSLLNQTKRVVLETAGDGSELEWVEVRTISIGALREMRKASSNVVPVDGEDKEEAQGFELSKIALEACIVDWSDDAPVNAENIQKLPYQYMFKLTAAIGLGEQEVPLASGPSSTDTSPA
jgi:hypothetical protein